MPRTMKTEYTYNELVDEIMLSELEPLLKNALVYAVCLNAVTLEYLADKNRENDIDTLRKRAGKLLEEFDRHYLERQRMFEEMEAKKHPIRSKIMNLVN